MLPKILSTQIALPPHKKSLTESLPYVEHWIQDLPERQQKKILRIFKYAMVENRYSIRDVNEMFNGDSFQQRNDYYIKHAIELATEALTGALEKANLLPQDIDFIITTSCTGFMIPSVDAFVINRLKMRQDIVRLPVTEMGCAAGTSALIYANNFLKAHPGKKAAIIAVEFPSCTFQQNDYSMTNVVSAAIFGDGVACTILGPSKEVKPTIIGGEMYHFPDAIEMMGYEVKDSGFHMVLDIGVPSKIEEHFDAILFPFLKKYGLGIEDVEHFIFHPGGKKIIQMVEGLLHDLGKNIDETKGVLRDYGNMSSATVLYVLDRFMEKEIEAGEHGLMLSFGPGFSAQRVLFQWT